MAVNVLKKTKGWIQGMNLTEAQKKAVEHTGSPALVVAGAGSGKTRTLTAKIRYLIENGFQPERILAITFTNKAAEEMKKRLTEITGLGQKRFPWVRTCHSACLQILKKHCADAGYQHPVQILTPYHQQKTVTEILVKLNMDKKHASNVLYSISSAKNSGNPDEYFRKNPRLGHIRMQDVFNAYETALKERNSVDFDNILLQTRNILKNNGHIREMYRNYFQFILVDEYQDTNNLQEEITRLLLGHKNIFCVGDDWQAIYGFRGSNLDHFLSFPDKYEGARIFKLEQNFRSADEIVKTAGHIISRNPCRMEKECFSDKKGGIIEIHDFSSETDEAGWVARKVESIVDMGIPYDKIAVLYRTKFCSLSFEKIFRMYRIPYQLVGSKGFFERMEIMDINSYLSAAVYPKDDVSFERILNTPKRGIGPAMVKKIGETRMVSGSLQDAARNMVRERLLPPRIHAAITELISILDSIRDKTPDTAVKEIIRRTGYLDYLRSISKDGEAEFTTRNENIEQLVFSASQKDNIVDYLEEAALIREDKNEEDDEQKKKGVSLLTIHASKGLEFNAVFIAGCEENLFPHWKSLGSESELREERRLMYVAMTRSERLLFLTCSAYRKGQQGLKSRFLYEIEHKRDLLI